MKIQHKDPRMRQVLEPGDSVILDGLHPVIVVNQSPQRLYTMVTDGDEKWDVMTYRLELDNPKTPPHAK